MHMAKKSFSISSNIANGLIDSIRTVSSHKGELNYEMMAINMIEPDPENPRKLKLSLEDIKNGVNKLSAEKISEFEALEPLIDSIKKVGVRNAIEVYKFNNVYRIISGERRWLASLAAGKEYIRVHICDKPSDFDLRYLQWIENIQREDLSLWEKYQNLTQITKAYKEHHSALKAITADELGKILGTSQRQSYRYLALINAEPDVIAAVQMGKITNIKLLEEVTKLKDINTRNEILNNLEKNHSKNKILLQVKQAKNPIKSKPKFNKQGRPSTKINLGYIEKQSVAKVVFDILLDHQSLAKYKDQFCDVDWASIKNINQAFKKILILINTDVIEHA